MADLLNFSPYRTEPGARSAGCLACRSFVGEFYGGHMMCHRDGGREVIGVPAVGFAFWMREAWTDDE